MALDVTTREELGPDQLGIAYEYADDDEPTLRITVRGEPIIGLDAQALEDLNVAIAGHANLGMLRTIQPLRAVHRDKDELIYDCPDCTRGLVGDHAKVGNYLRCIGAVMKDGVEPCHQGCVIACGIPRSY